MSLIYRKAQNVVIWLGEHDEWAVEREQPDLNDIRAQRAFGAICQVVNHWKGQDSPMRDATYRFYSETNNGKATLSDFEIYPKNAIKQMESQAFVQALNCHYPRTELPRKSAWIDYGFQGKIL
jgi:hypothetical protein